MQADRKTSGVHVGQAGEPMQKPSFTWATMRGPSSPLLSYTVVESQRMIAATDLGIGTGHSSVGEQDKARAILGVPEGYEVAYLLGVGYPADRPLKPIRKPNRRPFDEVVHRGHW